jgi:hypothetical protein
MLLNPNVSSYTAVDSDLCRRWRLPYADDGDLLVVPRESGRIRVPRHHTTCSPSLVEAAAVGHAAGFPAHHNLLAVPRVAAADGHATVVATQSRTTEMTGPSCFPSPLWWNPKHDCRFGDYACFGDSLTMFNGDSSFVFCFKMIEHQSSQEYEIVNQYARKNSKNRHSSAFYFFLWSLINIERVTFRTEIPLAGGRRGSTPRPCLSDFIRDVFLLHLEWISWKKLHCKAQLLASLINQWAWKSHCLKVGKPLLVTHRQWPLHAKLSSVYSYACLEV